MEGKKTERPRETKGGLGYGRVISLIHSVQVSTAPTLTGRGYLQTQPTYFLTPVTAVRGGPPDADLGRCGQNGP